MKKSFILLCLFCLVLSACGNQAPDSFNKAAEAVKNGTPPDFTALQAVNPDVIAWLTIPGTEINEPILRREGEDSFYQTHAPDGKNAGTAVFSQSAYNSADMSDPITVLYGSNQRQFANLQHRYTENGSLEQFGTVIVYTPTETLSYRVFGAGAFTDTHLLHTYRDDSSTLIRDWFRYHVMSRQYDGTTSIPDGAKLLVLSTHAREDDDQRFLILATTA